MMSWAVEELKKLSEIKPEIVESALQQLWKVEPEFISPLL